MKRTILLKILASVALILFSTVVFASKPPDDIQKAKILKKTYRMQVPFIENKGQIESKDVSFYAKTFGGTLFVEKNGTLTYNLPFEGKGGVGIKEIFTDKKIAVKGLDLSPTRVNYFKGKDKNKWRSNIPSYESVSLGEIYEGIELKLRAHGNNVEKLFAVLPGENPEKIKIELQGAKGLEVNAEGELEVITELGSVKFTKPIAYQEINGKRVEINVIYKLINSKSQISNRKFLNSPIPESLNSKYPESSIQHPVSCVLRPSPLLYGFKVGEYNKNYPLIIDPLLASTFIGGSSSERGYSIVLDEAGNVYVTGWTQSSDFPTTPGAYDEDYNDGFDIFVSKLDSDLTSLLASTFIGGGDDEGSLADYNICIALDGGGNVYVTGTTQSADYPTTPGAYDTSCNGGGYVSCLDAFISKLDDSLTTLLASTFIGGSLNDIAASIRIDGNGYVYVAGYTLSADYPTTTGAYDESLNGTASDAFISKLDSNLTSLLASTFIGGSSSEACGAAILDGSGNVYVTGMTQAYNYPITPGAYDNSHNGGADVYISKLDSDLTSLLASTFIGGGDGWYVAGDEYGTSIALDVIGNVYVTGWTDSLDYPTTSGAYDESFNGYTDVFVSKLDTTLSSLMASTFIGGENYYDHGYYIALDESGNVYVTGSSFSPDYPTTAGAYNESGTGVFISKLDNTLSFLLASTYIGADGVYAASFGRAIALDTSGNVCVAGYTNSSNYYPTTPGAYDESFNGGQDVFVSKLDSDLSADTTTTTVQISTTTTTTIAGTSTTTTTVITDSTTTTTASSISTTTTAVLTTTTVSPECPSDSPIDCGNGWCCPLDFPVCGLDSSEGYCFKCSTTQESSEIITLNSGTINGQSINPSSPHITVATGSSITGTVNITLCNSNDSQTAVPVCATPNWGDRTAIYWTIDGWAPVGGTSYYVDVDLTAPNTEGAYYILFGSSGEFDCGDVVSNTNWAYGDPVWNDGNDYADFDEAMIQTAIQNGWVEASKLASSGFTSSRVGANAVKITVIDDYTTTTTIPSDLILITGVVKDKFSSESIVGALVTIDGSSAITGNEGKYNLYQGPGTWIMKVETDAYVTRAEEITVDAGDQVINKDFLMIPLVQVTGKVTDVSTNNPVEEALVNIGGDYDNSNEEGKYNMVKAPGDWSVEVTASGYAPHYEIASIKEGERNVEINFDIMKSGLLGSVAGTISDLDTGEPIEWAEISTDNVGLTYSDMNGNYNLTEIPGTWTIVVNADGYLFHIEEITFDEGEIVERNIKLSPIATTTTVLENPIDFVGIPTIGFCPLTVQFANLSKGDIERYEWDFGDGETSTEEDPTHTYKTGGIYTVRLVNYGTDGGSLRQEVKPNYILVLPCCAFESALDSQEEINILRTLRESMLDNIFGVIATYIYYQNSAEVASILATNPELQDKLRDFVSKNIGVAIELINGSGASIPGENVDELIDFLTYLKKEGSSKLKADITLVVDAINAGYFLYGLGVNVE